MPLSSTPSRLPDGNGRCSTSPSMNSTSAIFAPADLDQLGADVEADAVVAGARQQIGEHARTTAEIGDARAAGKAAQPHESVDQPRAGIRREHVVFVRGSMAVEERDLLLLVLLLVLLLGRGHRDFTGTLLQHDQRIERHAAARERHERIDVDRLDDVAEINRKTPERDQRVDHCLDVEPGGTAIAVQKLAAAHAIEQVAGLLAADRRRAEGHVLDELEQHAAAAGHHHEPHLGVAMEPEHQLQAAADLLADQHAAQSVLAQAAASSGRRRPSVLRASRD